MRKTKIICTIGPASNTPEQIEHLIKGGMNVARLNFSHGDHEQHAEKIRLIREISLKLGQYVAILQDLAGPKIRIGTVPDPGIRIKTGQIFTLTNQPVTGSEKAVSVTYPQLPSDVHKGDIILIADGTLELKVLKTTDSEIQCRVIIGGLVELTQGDQYSIRDHKHPFSNQKRYNGSSFWA